MAPLSLPPRHRSGLALSALLTVGLTALGAPAHAASSPLVPLYPLDAPAAPMTELGTAGFAITAVDGVPNEWTTVMTPTGATTLLTAAFVEPDIGSGTVLSPGVVGTFTISATGSSDAGAAFFITDPDSTIPTFDGSSEAPPVGPQHSDAWAIFQNAGSWTYHLDFSSLPGGVLPAGSAFSANDVDVSSVVPERVSFSSPGAGSWMEYYAAVGSGVPGAVSFDDTTDSYDVVAETVAGYSNLTQTFRTTKAVRSVDITLAGATPSGGGTVWWNLALPVVAEGTEPTVDPTPEPIVDPAPEPSPDPAEQPTEEPTAGPTTEPAQKPTEQPAPDPSEEPTSGSSSTPSAPSTEPTPPSGTTAPAVSGAGTGASTEPAQGSAQTGTSSRLATTGAGATVAAVAAVLVVTGLGVRGARRRNAAG